MRNRFTRCLLALVLVATGLLATSAVSAPDVEASGRCISTNPYNCGSSHGNNADFFIRNRNAYGQASQLGLRLGDNPNGTAQYKLGYDLFYVHMRSQNTTSDPQQVNGLQVGPHYCVQYEEFIHNYDPSVPGGAGYWFGYQQVKSGIFENKTNNIVGMYLNLNRDYTFNAFAC